MKDKEDESYIRQKDNIKSKTSLLLSGRFALRFSHDVYTGVHAYNDEWRFIAHKRFTLTSIPVSANL